VLGVFLTCAGWLSLRRIELADTKSGIANTSGQLLDTDQEEQVLVDASALKNNFDSTLRQPE